jgi:hypothetical protein
MHANAFLFGPGPFALLPDLPMPWWVVPMYVAAGLLVVLGLLALGWGGVLGHVR